MAFVYMGSTTRSDNLLDDFVGRKGGGSVLNLTAIPIQDLGGGHPPTPRRIQMKLLKVDGEPSIGDVKLTLWDENATNETEISKIMKKTIKIKNAFVNSYRGDYQCRIKDFSQIKTKMRGKKRKHQEESENDEAREENGESEEENEESDDEEENEDNKSDENDENENGEAEEEEDEENENGEGEEEEENKEDENGEGEEEDEENDDSGEEEEEEEESDEGEGESDEENEVENQDSNKNVSLPKKKPRLTIEKQTKIVFFDLETTGINHPARHDGVQICSIAAATKTECGKWARFTKFLIPTCNFMYGATEINGMTVRQNQAGQSYLYKRGERVKEAVPIQTGLQIF